MSSAKRGLCLVVAHSMREKLFSKIPSIDNYSLNAKNAVKKFIN
jgi:hypothetical protein